MEHQSKLPAQRTEQCRRHGSRRASPQCCLALLWSTMQLTAAFHGTPVSQHHQCQHRRAGGVLRMSDISDRDLYQSLRNRKAQLEMEQAKDAPPFVVYDAKEAKSIYYSNFWKSRNLRKRKVTPSGGGAVVDDDEESGDEGGGMTSFSSSQEGASPDSDYEGPYLESSLKGAPETTSSRLSELKQLHYKASPQVRLASTTDTAASVHQWTDEELLAAYTHYYEMAKNLRGLEEVATAPVATSPSLMAQLQVAIDDALGGPNFLERAEVKHSRAAMLALLGITINDLMSGSRIFEPAAALAQAGGHATLPTVLASMVAVAAALEANFFWGNGQTLEQKCSAAAGTAVSRVVRFLAAACEPRGQVSEEVVVGAGERLTVLARHAEVGHGRLAILAIALMASGLA
eukprot:TRINITY_DN7144_c0_g1_i1.p1 TRINITY_DN7144_c0_g1~~TRINITY_DN7144_c0_g1_i1.p1  ORF type:complete len:402 (+),score=85.30 TRINITY_DN7144_c0_g1_i1:126-1331(+)